MPPDPPTLVSLYMHTYTSVCHETTKVEVGVRSYPTATLCRHKTEPPDTNGCKYAGADIENEQHTPALGTVIQMLNQIRQEQAMANAQMDQSVTDKLAQFRKVIIDKQESSC